MRFTNGLNYVFQIEKRKLKRFPNQGKYLSYVISTFEKQDLHDMKSPRYKKRVIHDKLFSFIYITTLLALELLALKLFFNFRPDSIFSLVFMIIIAVIVFIFHMILLTLVWAYIDKLRNKTFYKEYNEILKEYNEENNARAFLNGLTSIKNQPKGEQAKNIYYLSKSTALYENNRIEEALACLDDIQISDKRTQKAVAKQKKTIEGTKPYQV